MVKKTQPFTLVVLLLPSSTWCRVVTRIRFRPIVLGLLWTEDHWSLSWVLIYILCSCCFSYKPLQLGLELFLEAFWAGMYFISTSTKRGKKKKHNTKILLAIRPSNHNLCLLDCLNGFTLSTKVKEWEKMKPKKPKNFKARVASYPYVP